MAHQRGRIGQAAFGVAHLALLAFAPAALAAPGDLDPAFSQDGKVTIDFTVVEDVSVEPGDRTLIAGAVGGSSQDLAVARLTAGGDLDPAFNGTGVFRLDLGGNESASAVAPAPGGGAYVAIHQSQPTSGEMSVLRLAADGRPDPGFSGDGTATAPVDVASATASDLAPTPDGDVIVVGTAGTGPTEDIALARFGPDGAPDPALGGDGTARTDLGRRESARAMAVDGSGRIVVSGRSEISEPLITRYLPTGDLDTGFSGDGFDVASGYTPNGFAELALLTDGRIVTAGIGAGGDGVFSSFPTMLLRTYSDAGEVAGFGRRGPDRPWGDLGPARRRHRDGLHVPVQWPRRLDAGGLRRRQAARER